MPKRKPQGIRKRGNVWYIRVQQNGVRRTIPAGSDLSEAIKLYQQIKKNRYNDSPIGPKPLTSTITYDKAVDEYWENHLRFTKSAMGRVKCNIKGLKALFQNRDISSIQWQELEAYKNKRLTQVKPSVVKKELIYAGAIFKRQIKFGRLTANPIEMIAKPKVQDTRERILSQEEFLKLLNITWEVDNRGVKTVIPIKNHLRLALVIADFTAMRLGEILAMTWDQVDLKTRLIHIPESKTGRKRFVPIHNELRKILAAQTRESPYVICYHGKPIAIQIRTAFNKAREKAEIKDFHFHDLRHRAVTRWVQEGKPIDLIRKASGHSTYSAFARYSNLKDGDVLQLVGKKSKPLPIITYKEYYGLKAEKVGQSGYK